MFIKILCFVLVSAAFVQSQPTSIPEPAAGAAVTEKGIFADGKEKISQAITDIRSRVRGFFSKLRKATDKAIDENVKNFGKEIDSIVQIGNATINAIETIVDAKVKLIKSIPEVAKEAIEGLNKEE